MLLISYPVDTGTVETSYKLDLIETSVQQPVNTWNTSINSKKTVLEFIKAEYYSGNNEKAKNTCQNYFEVQKEHAIYLVNSSHQNKICGNYNISPDDTLNSKQVITPAIQTNNTIIKPKSALMVIKN